MLSLLVATTNPGKLREIRGLLDDLPLSLASLADFPAIVEPEEHGATFAENARDKARYYATASGLHRCRGLGPGDRRTGWRSGRALRQISRRNVSRQVRNDLHLLDERGVHDSAARFVCALALARGTDIVFEAEGTIEGIVTRNPRGSGGFG